MSFIKRSQLDLDSVVHKRSQLDLDSIIHKRSQLDLDSVIHEKVTIVNDISFIKRSQL